MRLRWERVQQGEQLDITEFDITAQHVALDNVVIDSAINVLDHRIVNLDVFARVELTP